VPSWKECFVPDESDPLLASIVGVLRAPVDLGPALEQRVLAALAREQSPEIRRPWRHTSLAWAAVLGGVLLAGGMMVRDSARRPSADTPTLPVRLSLRTAATRRVAVVGDFNNWDPRATMLTRRGEQWTTTLHLRPGRYRYTFLVDDARWVADPDRSPAADPDFDRPTSLLTVSH
jgi:hypothetical protein